MNWINLLKASYSSIYRTQKALNHPIHLQIEPTTDCNLRCQFCNRARVIKTPKQIGVSEFKEIFDQIKPSSTTLSGRGEPLLARDLSKMISHAKQGGSKTIITTNFTLGARYAEELIEAGVEDIRISLDASTPEVYRKMRGADHHEEILKGIHKVNEIKRRKGKEAPHLGFEVVMTKDNTDEYPGIILLAEKYNVKRVNFRILNTMGVEDKTKDLLIDREKDEFLRLLYHVKKRGRDTGVRTNADELIRDFALVWEVYRGGVNPKPDCLHPWLQVYVNVNGEVAPCCALNMDEGISLGNVFQDKFVEIWNSEPYKNIRKMVKEKRLPFQSCKHCPSKGLSWIVSKFNFFQFTRN